MSTYFPLKKHLPSVSSSSLRYLIAGGVSYIIELSCLMALLHLLSISVEVATAVAFWIGLFTSFLFQKLFAFRDYQKEVKAISKQFVVYAVLVVFNYVFTLALVGLFPSHLIILSRTSALLITTTWNYAVYNKLIFLSYKDRKL